MYKIYADGKLLYAPNLTTEGWGVFSPRLTTELNKPDSLEYTMPPNNVLYDEISKLKTIITAFQNGEEIFRGRVLSDEKDFFKQKKTNCEGELAFLIDSQQRPYVFEGTAEALFRQYIANHNSRVEESKRFTVGIVNASAASDGVYVENKNHSTTWNEIATQLIDYRGGYLKVRGEGNTRYIDWLEEYGVTNTQTIEFGVNLLDITEYITAEDIFTVIVPVGASMQDAEGNDLGKLDITSVNDGKDYLENPSTIAVFGRIETSMEWSSIEDAAELKAAGEAALNNNIELAVTLTVKAVDLHLLNVEVERIRLGDLVRVISLPHGLDKYFQCTKIVHDLVNPDQTEYIFGVNFTSLTDQQVGREKNISGAVSIVQSTINAANHSVAMANQASKNVETVIATLPTEYVKTTTFEAHKSEFNELKNDFDSLMLEFNDLKARVAALEGGTT